MVQLLWTRSGIPQIVKHRVYDPAILLPWYIPKRNENIGLHKNYTQMLTVASVKIAKMWKQP